MTLAIIPTTSHNIVRRPVRKPFRPTARKLTIGRPAPKIPARFRYRNPVGACVSVTFDDNSPSRDVMVKAVGARTHYLIRFHDDEADEFEARRRAALLSGVPMTSPPEREVLVVEGFDSRGRRTIRCRTCEGARLVKSGRPRPCSHVRAVAEPFCL